MICVSVGRGRHRMMMAEHKHLAEQGVQLVELRLDYIRRPVNLARLLKDRPCPVVATCRRPQDSGKWMRSEEDRLMLLRTAIANQADYVDLEAEIAKKIPRYGPTQRIISYHNFDETPKKLEDIHKKLMDLDPDIIKIATMANNPIDNIRTLRLCRDSAIPTVAFCMGEMGLASRVLCGRFGAPMTYATFHDDRKMAPGQISYTEMREKYNYENIGPDTQLFGVIADPVAHSLSPIVHNALIRDAKLDMLYLPFRVPSQYLDEFLEYCPEMGIKGLSVTIPHKEKVLPSINALDDYAAGIKACNTIVFKDVNAFGYNTDCDAALKSLRRELLTSKTKPADAKKGNLSDGTASDGSAPAATLSSDDFSVPEHEATIDSDTDPLPGLRVLILGAGGVARAIAFGLIRSGAKVTISARDHRKGEDLAETLKCKAIDWPGRQNHDFQVLINCTPVGMHPNLDESPFESDWLHSRHVVFDTVYTPEQTLLIKYARQADCKTITGVDMFVRQAARQFKLFTGKPANKKLIRYEIKRAISAARY